MHNPVDDQIRLTAVGCDTRFRCGDRNVLFVNLDPPAVEQLYQESVSFVRGRLAPRLPHSGTRALTDEEFGVLTQEIALGSMYYYAVNSLPVQVDEQDLRGSATYRLIRDHCESKFGAQTPEAISLAAHLTGISQHEFRKWMRNDDRYQDR